MAAAIIDYSRTPDEELDHLAQSIYNSLNPNAFFTWKADVMPLFQTNIKTFREKLEIVMNEPLPKNRTAKKEAKKVLTSQMRDLAIEANVQSQGDLGKLQTTAFKLAKERAPIGTLPKPTGFKVKSGENSGELLAMVDAYKDADMYFFYIAQVPVPENIDNWRLVPSTSCKKTIKGLIPGKQYELKCAYKGASEELIFSDPILIYIQ
jgi:hypothetical protein